MKDLRMAGIATLDQANRFLETDFLPWWQKNLTVEPQDPEDAHRPLEQGHDLAAILCHVESRTVKTGYTFQIDGKQYVIERADIRTGLRGGKVRVEKRRDGTLAVRFEQQYLRYRPCEPDAEQKTAARPASQKPAKKPGQKSAWMREFELQKSPSIGKAIAISNAKS